MNSLATKRARKSPINWRHTMKGCDCEICKHWAAAQSNDFPCDECDGKTYFEYAESPSD